MNQFKAVKNTIRVLVLAGWMLVIFLLSAQTGEEVNTFLPWFQKLFPAMQDFNWGHFVTYFVLAAAFDFGIGARSERIVWKLVIIAACGLYGVTDEYHQSFVAGRSTDVQDIKHDLIGAFLWTVVIMLPPLLRIWRRIALRA
ncbi:VanZ family protein [Paenibacillus sp. HB172176]|uniref:VanZ family protein n=1 Tax=Paenibacillus sp. HB172176 TaxID=2493690 RepID=UPI00143A0526|nr:VanZ family protein [Paenibacillus sp. HB172176]